MKILVDHNIEGHANRLWDTLEKHTDWADLLSIEMLMFADVGLSTKSSDRDIWRYAQKHKMLLITENRNMEGDDSLEQTIREENTPTSLPVLNIRSVDRIINERKYRQSCALSIAEIIIYLENFLGTGDNSFRLYNHV